MTEASIREVGVDLQEFGEDVRGVLTAIERDNPAAQIKHLPGLIKVSAPSRLVIRRETVEQALGREWDTQELQLWIVSYFGHIGQYDDDEIVISWDH
jgi:phenol/toluene 2-monooxygenase (NADH) P2/A2